MSSSLCLQPCCCCSWCALAVAFFTVVKKIDHKNMNSNEVVLSLNVQGLILANVHRFVICETHMTINSFLSAKGTKSRFGATWWAHRKSSSQTWLSLDVPAGLVVRRSLTQNGSGCGARMRRKTNISVAIIRHQAGRCTRLASFVFLCHEMGLRRPPAAPRGFGGVSYSDVYFRILPSPNLREDSTTKRKPLQVA